MAISKESKQTLKYQMAILDDQKSSVQKLIDDLDAQRIKLVSRKQDLSTAINNLKTDIDNG